MSDIVRALHAQLACLWEASARKPGNVHRFRDFADTSYLEFAASAAAIGPAFASADRTVGEIVLAGVRATRQVTSVNTNLGILLLLAPLAVASTEADFRADVERVLGGLNREDAEEAYEAIRLANPGGLGKVDEGDIVAGPDRGMRELMSLAADRDLVARQYANGFREVFEEGIPTLSEGIARTGCLEGGIIKAHLHLMSRYPDTLIARKLGGDMARDAASRAAVILDAGWPDGPGSQALWHAFDDWLRQDGNARNPGTTADLIAACLFAMLRQLQIVLPLQIPWTRPNLIQDR